MDLELFKIPASATVLEAAQKIDKNHLRCVFIVEGEKVIGACSQGDIIRMLLQGGNEFTQIEKVMKPSFLYVHEKDWKKAFDLMRKFGVTVIPVLDAEFHLQDVMTMPMILEKIVFSQEKL